MYIIRCLTLYTAVTFSLIFLSNVEAQTSIKYTYDDSGNRIEKRLYIGGQKKSESIPGYVDSINQPPKVEEKFVEVLAETTITLYPNPTEGRLIIQVEKLPEGQIIRLYVHDINGRTILNKSQLAEVNEVELTTQPSGTYFLTISIGNQVTRWTIIKQ